MNLSELLVVALILLPVWAAALWVRMCMTQSEHDLDAFSAMEGQHSAFRAQARGRTEGT